MSTRELQTGDVVLMKNFTRFGETPTVQVSWKFRQIKGEVYAFLLLGTAPIGMTREFNADAVLEALGWKFVGDEALSENRDASSVQPEPSDA